MTEIYFGSLAVGEGDYSKLQKNPGVSCVSIASRLLDICERHGSKLTSPQNNFDPISVIMGLVPSEFITVVITQISSP